LSIVGGAGTEAEAKLWLEDHRGGWDVAVIDLVLDRARGWASSAAAGAILPAARSSCSAATPRRAVRQHCLDLGADAVFDKTETGAFISWFNDLVYRENSGP
jgi:hypothetical protein